MVANHEVSSTGERTIQNLPENTQGEPFKSESRKELVYNFMVADCHEYFVNDILVHNCIGWLLTHWFITKAQNLSFYGIDATALLRDVREVSELTPEQKLRDQQQRRLRQRVEELTELIKTTPEDVLQMRYEHELRLHYSRMEFMENDRISVDEVIKAAREERSRRRYSNPSQGNPVQARNSFHNKMRDFQIRATSMSGFGR
jgi:F0F1-type ATP synthase assembly protein I